MSYNILQYIGVYPTRLTRSLFNNSMAHIMATMVSLVTYIPITLFTLDQELSLLLFSLVGCSTSGSPSG